MLTFSLANISIINFTLLLLIKNGLLLGEDIV
jgi:hypothetical protein